VPILATGSAALTPAPRPPEVPSQYQILRIHRGGLQQWCRAYAPESDRRGFIGDTRAAKDGRDWQRSESVPWQAVDGVFPRSKDAATPARAAEQVPDGASAPWHRQPPGQRDPEPDDFLAEVGTVCRMRERGRVEIKRRRLDGGASDYLAVTVSDDGLTRTYPLIAFEQGIELDALRAFIADVVARHRSRDPRTRPLVIHGAGSPPEDAARALMQRHRLHCISFIEHQGLIDFGRYLSEQTGRLETDRIYPPRLYIPQRMDYRIGIDSHDTDDALAQVRQWMEEPTGRFVLILGDFGTGKTFLLRELARRLGDSADAPIPILVEMRELEKGRSLDELIAQHLARHRVEAIDLRAFHYMLDQGRICLLFDGFDELAVRISYDRVTRHLETLLGAAAARHAKVVVTSRTQHFQSDAQVMTALGKQVESLPRHRIGWIRRFDTSQIRAFLTRRLGDAARAERRFALINAIKDLLGLSHNPRMLAFIADLSEADLEAAKDRGGDITPAALYEALLRRWIEGEQRRVEPTGAEVPLQIAARWRAVRHLAEALWPRTEPTLALADLTVEVQAALEDLQTRSLAADEAAHQVGSGTLLVRDAEGRFGFIHQSRLRRPGIRQRRLQRCRSQPSSAARMRSDRGRPAGRQLGRGRSDRCLPGRCGSARCRSHRRRSAQCAARRGGAGLRDPAS